MSYQTLEVKVSHVKNSEFILDDVKGINVLDEFETWAKGLSTDHFKDPVTKSYGTKPSVDRRNRLVMLTMRTGHYGSEGDWVVNTKTHQMEYKTEDHDAQTIETRCALLVPPGSKTALFFVEKQGHEGCGGRVAESFQGHLKSVTSKMTRSNGKPLEAIVTFKTVVAGDAWLEAAKLRSVTAVANEYTSDIAASSAVKDVPMKFSSTLTPALRTAWLPAWVRDVISDKKVKAAADLGFPGGLDYDELIIELGDGDQRKTMVVGKERTPAIRRMLNNYGEPSLSPSALVDRIDEEAKSYYERNKLGWDYKWTRKQ